MEQPAFEPAFQAFSEEQPQEVWMPPVEQPEIFSEPQENFELPKEEPPVVEETQPVPELTLPPTEEATTTAETQAELEEVMTPEPVVENLVEEKPVEENFVVENLVEEKPVEENFVEPLKEELPKEEPPIAEEKVSEEDKKIAAMTQQAEDLKAALKKARASQHVTASEPKAQASQKKQVEKAVDERRRRVLLGKHATKTILTESGTIVVEAGAEVTEEVLQRARLSNKFIELSMNVQ